MIEEFRSDFTVEKICAALAVSKSGYYKWRKCSEPKRYNENQNLLKKIKNIHDESHGIFGSPTINIKLRELNIVYNHKRIEKLMRDNNIRSKAKKKFIATTNSNHQQPVAPNLLQRDFNPCTINEAWCSDITYIRTGEGWLYLATVMDLHSRKIIGWETGSRMTRQLVINAFNNAYNGRNKPKGVIFHSDRGSQYASLDFRNTLKKAKALQSMSRKGDCWDNACAESFFASLKKEKIYRNNYFNREQARKDIFWYIEIFYNRYRPHSFLGGMSPQRYEEKQQKGVA